MRRFLISTLMILVSATQPGIADDSPTSEALEKGRAIAFDRNKGNCLACHAIEGGELAGNYGPPLLLMKVRRAQIWDASTMESTTRMPPYGRHRILTEEEIDLVVDFIHTL